ncbi:MAG: cyclic nucleotide-binding domain-containing protein [Thermodesulfobacteriota bacterium]
MTTELEFLAQVPIFSRLSPQELQRVLDHAERQEYQAGEEIIREGETDARLFVILEGAVDVIKDRGTPNEKTFATIGIRDYFGEMALIDNLARSATVVARKATSVLCIDQKGLYEAIEKNPSIAMELLKMFSQRVRALEKCIVRNLGGLLPICMNCKSIRDQGGNWVKLEDYISDHTEADFTHGICPECHRRLYPHHFAKKET